MDLVIQAKNFSFIEDAIREISFMLGLSGPREVLWLAFGSYVINANSNSSDLDLIGIHNSFTEKKRQEFNYKNVPVHFMTINADDLKDDGAARLYGGYFSGKIINPHIFLYGNEKSKNEAVYHAGKFIGIMAGYLGQLSAYDSFSPSQITALVFIAYMSTDPSFDSYFLNYFASPNFKKIWQSLCKTIIDMLDISGSVQLIGDKYIFTQKFNNYKSFHVERMKISARHWSYGAVCHGGDRKFQDKIFTKAEEKIKKIDPYGEKYKKMVFFLQEQSGLAEIYI